MVPEGAETRGQARQAGLDQRGLQLLVHACHDGDPDHQQHGAEYGFATLPKPGIRSCQRLRTSRDSSPRSNSGAAAPDRRPSWSGRAEPGPRPVLPLVTWRRGAGPTQGLRWKNAGRQNVKDARDLRENQDRFCSSTQTGTMYRSTRGRYRRLNRPFRPSP